MGELHLQRIELRAELLNIVLKVHAIADCGRSTLQTADKTAADGTTRLEHTTTCANDTFGARFCACCAHLEPARSNRHDTTNNGAASVGQGLRRTPDAL